MWVYLLDLTEPISKSVPGPAEKLFNRRLKRFRVWIEHTFGMFKKMFPIFLSALRKDLQANSQATIVSSCVLYNIARDLSEPEPDLPDTISSADFDRIMADSFDRTPSHLRDKNTYVRDQVVKKYFARQIRQ